MKQLNTFDYVLLGSLFYDNISPLLFSAVQKEKAVLGNFGLFTYPRGETLVWKNPENLYHLTPYVSYIFLDDREIMFVSQKKNLAEAIEFLQTKTDAIIVVTLGSKGSLIFMSGSSYEIPAFPYRALGDPTGAGDTYLAGFIRATQLYSEPSAWGKFAAMTATMKLEHRGAFKGNMRDVLSRLAQAGVMLS